MPKRKTHSQRYASQAAEIVRSGKRSGLFSREEIKKWIKRHKQTRDLMKKFD